MLNKVSDKEILYNMIRREVNNLLQGIPIFAAFGGTISNYIIKIIDPYINAFMINETELDAEQLESFAAEEVNNKIADFKEKYNKNKKGNTNYDN